jgi:hypothetical protein
VYFDVNDEVADLNNEDNTGVEMSVSSCNALDNIIAGVIESVDSTSFDSDLKISFTVQGLTNPSWGLDRGNT